MKIYKLILILLLVASCSDADETYYEIKGDEVVYHSVYRLGQEYYTKAHTSIKTVEDADAKTFQQLTKYYGIDKSNVFNEVKKLVKRDPATFKVLKKMVTADKYGVYYDNNIIPNSHGLSFRFLNNDYALDDNQVYYQPSDFNSVVTGADKNTFSVIGDDYSDYAKDKNQVYYKGYVIEGAVVGSFSILKNDISKDGKSIFFKKKKIKEADYNSFKTLRYEELKEYEYKFIAQDHNSFYSDNGGNIAITKKTEVTNEH
ncbi:DKNYY domain-containing protein [Zobellia laminariae]|uniref:DKNYY domain-containing protein n=1 Tax=Zobellia laminariae TaxID=248906 RepID=UPI001396B649